MENHDKTTVYLDHNATSPCKGEVVAALTQWLGKPTNPSSIHQAGQAARSALEAARTQVAGLCGLSGDEAWRVVFTSGATESNNTAHYPFGPDQSVWVSAVEHAATLQACDRGSAYRRMPVTPDGVLDLDALKGALDADGPPDLFSLMLVNNETGVIQPVEQAASLFNTGETHIHCDGVQAAGRIALNFHALGVDTLSLSSHKIAGPQGVGALVIRQGEGYHGMIHGGGQEKRRRAGTENLAGIIGFGVAAELASHYELEISRQGALRDELQSRLEALCGNHIRIIGKSAPRVANSLCFVMPGVSAERSLMALDLGGIAVSSGSACSSGKMSASHVLLAMGFDENTAATALRISFGWTNDEADLDRFMDVWTPFYNRVKERL